MNQEEAITQSEQDDSSPSYDAPHIPFDMIIEILSWLPVISLLRFKSVSKKFYLLMHDRKFILKNYEHSPPDAHEEVIEVRPALQIGEIFRFVRAFGGLILEKRNSSYRFRIRNPAIRLVLDLPSPHVGSLSISCSALSLFGTFKLVSLYYDKEEVGNTGCEILTVGGDDCMWKPLSLPIVREANRIVSLSTWNAAHFVRNVKCCCWRRVDIEILSLDFESECFYNTSLSHDMFSDSTKVMPFEWNGHLVLAEIVKEELHCFVLEDHKEKKWGARNVVPLPFMKQYPDTEDKLLVFHAHKSEIWFKWCGRIIFAYEHKLKRIVTLMHPGEGLRSIYPMKSSLITFEGMKPASSNPH